METLGGQLRVFMTFPLFSVLFASFLWMIIPPHTTWHKMGGKDSAQAFCWLFPFTRYRHGRAPRAPFTCPALLEGGRTMKNISRLDHYRIHFSLRHGGPRQLQVSLSMK